MRKGVALVAVLYFLVVCALSIAGLLFVERGAARNAIANANGIQLVAVAEDVLYSTLASWDGAARLRQRVGSTVLLASQPRTGMANVYVTRLTTRVFVIVADVRNARDGASRRVGSYVRVPLPTPSLRAALITDGDVRIGLDARVIADSVCGDPPRAALVVTPSAQLVVDPAAPQPTLSRDPAAADSTTYEQFGASTWNDIALVADLRVAAGAHVTPSPPSEGSACSRTESNWGDPTSLTSPCANYTPLVVADGDLTIDGGRGQGVLVVGGRLVIAGPFEYSGQIVARRGIETSADNIAISGVVYARRGDDSVNANVAVMLSHRTTIRYSGCDAWHGMASWLQPRRVRDYAWMELF